MKTNLIYILFFIPFLYVNAQCAGNVGTSALSVLDDHPDLTSEICFGEIINFTALVEGNTSATLVFQWQESTDGGLNWVDIAGETGQTFALTASTSNIQYRFQVSETADVGDPACTFFSPPTSVLNLYDVSSIEIEPLFLCDLDGNGIESFDLTQVIPEIVGSDDPADYVLTFHNSPLDAQNGINEIPDPSDFEPVFGNPWFVYVRVENLGCVSSNPIEFRVEFYTSPPVNSTTVDLFECDDDSDGFSIFNLNNANPQIIDDPNSFNIVYYNTLVGAQNQTASDEINNTATFSNSTASQVFANVSDDQGCASVVVTVNLVVTNSQLDPTFVFPVAACDDSVAGGTLNDGIATFDLTDAQNAIIGQYPAADQPNLEVEFYQNQDDAIAQVNEVPLIGYQNTTSPFSQNLFVRVNNTTNNSCFGLGEHVSLSTSEQPVFEVETPQYICLNERPKTLTVLNPQGDYTYTWYSDEDDLTGVVGLDIIAEVNSAGTYLVVATNADGSGCSTSMEIEVISSSIATITNIETDIANPNSTITIDFEGSSDEYEYNIDFEPFEDTNITLISTTPGPEGDIYTYQAFIENPLGGNQLVRVRDRHGCGVAIEEVCVLGFPKFFTPNGDGVNDRWQVFGAIDCFENARVNIFDRFGKLLKQFSSDDEGWNGTYNGREVPATDYWYTVEFLGDNPDFFKGHFSLKR